MSVWEQRGQVILTIVFVIVGLTFAFERIVFIVVTGPSALFSSALFSVIIVGFCVLIYRGIGWLRWLLAIFFVLNGLGTPGGLRDLVGPELAVLIAIIIFGSHLLSALLLSFTPGCVPSSATSVVNEGRDDKRGDKLCAYSLFVSCCRGLPRAIGRRRMCLLRRSRTTCQRRN
ncbi:hypothetical protein HC891_02610 [Candidatus Gracilibacteria bacterium]|nr:hypothetical protein [Candidatus Gracilibacteria bacterium]